MAAAREQLGKHVPAAADTHATIEGLLEMVFSIQSMQRGYVTMTPAIELSAQLKVRQ
jgi:hypothetical protein